MSWVERQVEIGGPVFVRGPVDRSGTAVYTHLIKSRTDPERSPRPKGGRADKQPHLTLRRRAGEDWGGRILELLADNVPRTFNRMGIELLDQEASQLLHGPLDLALWDLVARGKLELTMEAPILFRKAA